MREGSSVFYFLSFSGDGQKLAAGAEDGTSYLWDLQSQEQQLPAKGEQQDGLIYCVSLSPNGQMLATCSTGTGPVILWKLEEDKKKLINYAKEENIAIYLQPKGPDTVTPLYPKPTRSRDYFRCF